MTERDDQLSEGFLVDGVAPSVIGGDASPEPAGAGQAAAAGGGYDYQAAARREDFQPGTRREPPTTPIPAQPAAAHGGPGAQQTPDQRKGWLGRMFGRQ